MSTSSDSGEQNGKNAQIARTVRFPQDERERVAFRCMARSEPTVGFVYFIQAQPGTPVKVGYTGQDDVAMRLAQLQTGNPYPLQAVYKFRATMADEKKIHRALAPDRLSGEWFDCSPRFHRFWDCLRQEGLQTALVQAYADDDALTEPPVSNQEEARR